MQQNWRWANTSHVVYNKTNSQSEVRNTYTMKNYLVLFCLLLVESCLAQNWVDTTYAISTIFDINYGTSTDFKGAVDTLDMDISVPLDDIPPACGRPLLVVVHGGAWYSGDKGEGYPPRLREDFAKRGYVAASVNYRLGLFNTHQNIDCVLLEGWKCWNMADSSEWYRANYRAVQDVYGAIRFLVQERENYNINPDNVFLVGESAGGFIVLQAGFAEDMSEINVSQIESLADVSAPNDIYENSCIRAFGLAESIDEMMLSRPPLGAMTGTLHLPLEENYRIRGVGSFYGGAFTNVFETKTENSPALYLYHQPCDLIVPFSYNRLLAGFSTCATGFPSYCQHIINRPFVYGSNGIVALINNMEANDIPTCEVLLDNSGNNYSCFEQVANPSLGCHAIDNYWLRTTNMAGYFSEKVAGCTTTSTATLIATDQEITVFPNPARNQLQLNFSRTEGIAMIYVADLFGRLCITASINNQSTAIIDLESLESGTYQVWVKTSENVLVKTITKI